MQFPVKQPYIITNLFNAVTHPGIDIAPIDPGRTTRKAVAPENCTVVQAGYVASLEGNYVILKGKVKYYYFGHFKTRLVSASQKVTEGQAIGVIGQTGAATGIHTHHEVRNDPFTSGTVDPLAYYKSNVNNAEEIDMPTAGNINTVIFLGLRRRATTSEIGKFTKLPWGKLLAYVQDVQETHHVSPQPEPAPLTVDTVVINGKTYKPV